MYDDFSVPGLFKTAKPPYNSICNFLLMKYFKLSDKKKV